MSEAMPVWRFRLVVWLGTALIGFATACAEPSGLDLSIVVVPNVDTLVLGASTVFNVQLMGDAVVNGAPVQWLTSDSTVATVRADGRAHARATGTASIMASVAGVTSAPAMLVVRTPGRAIDLAPTRVSVRVGTVVLFTATVVEGLDESPDLSYTWTTSDPHVAVVFQVPSFPYALGVALQPGIAEIKAAAGDAVSPPSLLEVNGTAE